MKVFGFCTNYSLVKNSLTHFDVGAALLVFMPSYSDHIVYIILPPSYIFHGVCSWVERESQYDREHMVHVGATVPHILEL